MTALEIYPHGTGILLALAAIIFMYVEIKNVGRGR